MHEGTEVVEADLGDHEQRADRVGAVVGRAGAAVEVDRDVEVLQRGPQRVVDGVVHGRHPVDVGRHGGEQHPAAQARLLDPGGVGDGVVDVVQEDLADPGAAFGPPGAEVGHPAVVGVDAGAAVLVLVGLRGPGEEHEARVEGRHGVGEQHLADDAVGELVGVASLVVPVPDPQVGVAEVLPRVLVPLPPGVELLPVGRVEVLPVLGVAATGMGVGRDEGVRRARVAHAPDGTHFWYRIPVLIGNVALAVEADESAGAELVLVPLPSGVHLGVHPPPAGHVVRPVRGQALQHRLVLRRR